VRRCFSRQQDKDRGTQLAMRGRYRENSDVSIVTHSAVEGVISLTSSDSYERHFILHAGNDPRSAGIGLLIFCLLLGVLWVVRSKSSGACRVFSPP